jgi:hypothetical protein
MDSLPMEHHMAIHFDALRHKAEIAQAFAAARERLLPKPKKNALQALYEGMMNGANRQRYSQNALAPSQANPYGNPLAAANAAWQGGYSGLRPNVGSWF